MAGNTQITCANCKVRLYAPASALFKCPKCDQVQRVPVELVKQMRLNMGLCCNVKNCRCRDVGHALECVGQGRCDCKTCGTCGHRRIFHTHPANELGLYGTRLPDFWEGNGRKDEPTRNLVSSKTLELIQNLMDETRKSVATQDRPGTAGAPKRFEVVMASHIQHPKIWHQFDLKRKLIAQEVSDDGEFRIRTKTSSFHKMSERADCSFAQEKLEKQINEVYLFHGTKPSAADSICNEDFRLKKAGSNRGTLFGPGLYFAESISKSDEYAQDDDTGIYKGLYATLLCRVILGKALVNEEHNPNGDKLAQECYNGNYHSVLGDREKIRGTFREFIIFDSDMVYPEFLVVYRRVYNDDVGV